MNCTGSMLIFAVVDVYWVFNVSLSTPTARFEILGGFMKWGVRNKIAEKKLKMSIFKFKKQLWVLLVSKYNIDFSDFLSISWAY